MTTRFVGGPPAGAKIFQIDGFTQGVHLVASTGATIGCTCTAQAEGWEQLVWPGQTRCAHVTALRAVERLGFPESGALQVVEGADATA